MFEKPEKFSATLNFSADRLMARPHGLVITHVHQNMNMPKTIRNMLSHFIIKVSFSIGVASISFINEFMELESVLTTYINCPNTDLKIPITLNLGWGKTLRQEICFFVD